MKHYVLSFMFLFLGTYLTINAQNRLVQFDSRNLTFNEGNPLPMGEDLVFTGGISKNTVGVEIRLFSKKGEEKTSPIFNGFWRTPYGERSNTFRIPMNRKLKPGKRYDARISYYRDITDAEKAGLKKDVLTILDAYIDQSFDASKKKLKFVKKTKDVKADLDDIMRNALTLYMSKRDYTFKGFSDLTMNKLKELESASKRKGANIFSSGNKTEAKSERFLKLASDLKEQIRIEVGSILNMDWAVAYDSRYVDDYPTESGNFGLPIQVGYGVVFMDGVVDSLNYGHGAQIGLSIPMGREGSSGFFSNASLDIGIFLNDFKDGDDVRVTGPVVKKPIYVGLGYKLYKFININAGVVLLENQSTAGTISGVEERVFVRPFVGLNAKFNISLGK